jgi:hypothetical protein
MKFFVTLLFAGFAAQITATPIEVTRVNMFRDTTGRNDINIGVGDRFQYGVDIFGGSAGASLGAAYAPTGNTEILRRSTTFFNIASVGSRNTALIGMPAADKYEFLTGVGAPKFSSIKVPNFNTWGDGLYDLFIWNGVDYVDSGIDLTNGSQFYFDQLGVSRFALLGISD